MRPVNRDTFADRAAEQRRHRHAVRFARDIQQAGAGLRSLAEPVLDTTGDFAELVLAMLGVSAKLERRRIVERTARGRADAKAASTPACPAPRTITS